MRKDGKPMNHVRVRHRTAIIEFENCIENEHNQIIDELVHLVGHGFKSYIFDFTWIGEDIGSTTVGFVIAAVKKLIENNCRINLRNITPSDLETLNMVGLVEFSNKNENLSILIRED